MVLVNKIYDTCTHDFLTSLIEVFVGSLKFENDNL